MEAAASVWPSKLPKRWGWLVRGRTARFFPFLVREMVCSCATFQQYFRIREAFCRGRAKVVVRENMLVSSFL